MKLPAPLVMRCTLNRAYLKTGSGATVFVAIDLTPPEAAQVTPQPLSLSLAIDCSASMAGEKLDQAIEAAVNLVLSLSPSDLISVVSFEDKARIVLPLTSAKDKGSIEDTISQISLGKDTDMHAGLELAYKEALKGLGPGRVSRIVLLTDGRPTKGKKKAKDFLELSSKIRQDGISVYALGIGADYNDDLLTGMAQVGGGTWHHVTNPQDLPELFREQANEMARTVVFSPELRVSIMPDVELVDLYAVRPMLTLIEDLRRSDSTFFVPLRDLVAGQQQNLVLRLHLPPRPPGVYRVLRAELAGVGQDITVTYTVDERLFEAETDPYPRLLLASSEGTVLLREGISKGDQTAVRRAETIIRSITADPSAQTVLRSHIVADEIVTTLRSAYERTAMKGRLGESEKKQLLHETTLIKKRQS